MNVVEDMKNSNIYIAMKIIVGRTEEIAKLKNLKIEEIATK